VEKKTHFTGLLKTTVEEIKSGIKMIERKVYPEERVASIDDG